MPISDKLQQLIRHMISVAGPIIKDGYSENIHSENHGVKITGRLKLKSFNHTFAYANHLTDNLQLQGDFFYETETVDIRLNGTNDNFLGHDLKRLTVEDWFKKQNERLKSEGSGQYAQEVIYRIARDIIRETNENETPITVEFEVRDGVVIVTIKETTTTELKFSL